ncbi:hypothetical protein V7654_18780 [Bacillus sp. JJ1609]|uniref:hypothetical protein n=1 Tax=Bacillus sp. JJ1609 TaxID=3122977 RepID=UPI002FFD9137
MNTIGHISWEVTQLINEYGDEIEMDIIQYPTEYQVTVNICDKKPPFKDITTTAIHPRSKRKAAKQAMMELYKLAYPELFKIRSNK